MDSQTIQRFNDNILHEAMQRYGIAKNQIKPINTFENFIYEFEQNGEGYILRIGHSFRKSEALIQGEVDWINYLARGGVSVARAIPSQNGRLVEVIDDAQGGQFLVTAFVKAEGQAPWEAGWSTARYESYGELLGKMHELAVGYQPLPAWRRPEWDDPSMNFIEMYLPASEVIARREYQSLLKHLYTLPKDKNSYGLIHQDAHQNNFFMDANGKLTLFDFDECAYSWFVNDIAIVLFYISMDAQEFGYSSVQAFTQNFMTHFLRGYRKAYNKLDPRWLQEIPHFLKLRELELYAVVFRDFDINNIDDSWIANFMHERKMRIEAGLPFIEFDFDNMKGYLGEDVL